MLLAIVPEHPQKAEILVWYYFNFIFSFASLRIYFIFFSYASLQIYFFFFFSYPSLQIYIIFFILPFKFILFIIYTIFKCKMTVMLRYKGVFLCFSSGMWHNVWLKNKYTITKINWHIIWEMKLGYLFVSLVLLTKNRLTEYIVSLVHW